MGKKVSEIHFLLEADPQGEDHGVTFAENVIAKHNANGLPKDLRIKYLTSFALELISSCMNMLDNDEMLINYHNDVNRWIDLKSPKLNGIYRKQ